jgi:hypothetical protein
MPMRAVCCCVDAVDIGHVQCRRARRHEGVAHVAMEVRRWCLEVVWVSPEGVPLPARSARSSFGRACGIARVVGTYIPGEKER